MGLAVEEGVPSLKRKERPVQRTECRGQSRSLEKKEGKAPKTLRCCRVLQQRLRPASYFWQLIYWLLHMVSKAGCFKVSTLSEVAQKPPDLQFWVAKQSSQQDAVSALKNHDRCGFTPGPGKAQLGSKSGRTGDLFRTSPALALAHESRTSSSLVI